MKHKKPKSRVDLQLSKGRACAHCNKMDGTIVPAHYKGIYQHRLGAGMGCKVWDEATADLCQECHDAFDGRTNDFQDMSKEEISTMFLKAICKTIQTDILTEKLVSLIDFKNNEPIMQWFIFGVNRYGTIIIIIELHKEVQAGNLIYKR